MQIRYSSPELGVQSIWQIIGCTYIRERRAIVELGARFILRKLELERRLSRNLQE